MALGRGRLEESLTAGSRIFRICLDILTERLELLGIEARLAKVLLLQCLLLAGAGVALLVAGIVLAVAACLLVVPPPWRAAVAGGGAGMCLLAAGLSLWRLRRRLSRVPLAFSQTVEELRKDRECF